MKPGEWNVSGPAKIERLGGGGGAVSPSADTVMASQFDPITALASYLGILRSRQPGAGNPLAQGTFDPLAKEQAAPLEQLFSKLVGRDQSPFPSHHPRGGQHSSSSGISGGGSYKTSDEIERERRAREAADKQLAFQRQNERQQAALGLDLGRQQLGDARSKTNLRNNILSPQMIGNILQKIMSRY